MKASDRCSVCGRYWGHQVDGEVVGPFDCSDVCTDCHGYETPDYRASMDNDRREQNRINGRFSW